MSVQPHPSGLQRPSHGRAITLAVGVTVLWSFSWVLIRWGLDGESLEPITFAALRYGIAAALLVGWVLTRRDLRTSVVSMGRPTRLRIAVLGVVFHALTQGAQFVAIDNQPAATTSLMLSLSPIMVAWLSIGFLDEVPSRKQLVGTAVVVIGAWFYFAGDLGTTAVGMAAATIGLGANVSAAVMGRIVNRDAEIPPVVVTALSMAVGAAVLVLAGIFVEGVPTVSPLAWLIIVWLAVVHTALAFTLWNLSLRRLSAVESSGINNTMLVQIALLGWLFLGEPFGFPEFIGIILVSVGVALTRSVPGGFVSGQVGGSSDEASGNP